MQGRGSNAASDIAVRKSKTFPLSQQDSSSSTSKHTWSIQVPTYEEDDPPRKSIQVPYYPEDGTTQQSDSPRTPSHIFGSKGSTSSPLASKSLNMISVPDVDLDMTETLLQSFSSNGGGGPGRYYRNDDSDKEEEDEEQHS